MVEFHWKTTGSRNLGGLEIVRWPPTVILIIIIFLAVAVTDLITAPVRKQEEAIQRKWHEFEEIRSEQEKNPTPAREQALQGKWFELKKLEKEQLDLMKHSR